MAVVAFTNAQVTIGGTDLSDHVREVTIDDGVVELTDTVMGDTAESLMGGLKRWTITVKLLQDYAASKTHEVLRPLVNTNVALIIRPANAARSGTNPEWQATGFLSAYTPLMGAVGTLQEPSVVFKNSGSGISCLTAAT